MDMNDDLREMLKDLGQAINESISGSGRVHDSIQRIRDEGYNLYMVLDAKVGLNRREAKARSSRRKGARVEPIVEKVATGDQLFDEQARHDRLAGARVVGEEESDSGEAQEVVVNRLELVR